MFAWELGAKPLVQLDKFAISPTNMVAGLVTFANAE